MKFHVSVVLAVLLAQLLKGAEIGANVVEDPSRATLDRAERALRRGALSETIEVSSGVISADPKKVLGSDAAIVTIEGLGAASFVLSSPDDLGVVDGTYAFLGVLHRFARRF